MSEAIKYKPLPPIRTAFFPKGSTEELRTAQESIKIIKEIRENRDLTQKQIENWKKVFPEFRIWSDEMIQAIRDKIEKDSNG